MTQPDVFDTRYTDRDVRENPNMVEFATRYAALYRGDFEPMVDARRKLSQGRKLTCAEARKVLNCARNDSRISHLLPRPEYDLAKELATVVDLDSRREPEPAQMSLDELDDALKTYERTWVLTMPATLKVFYGIGRNGIRIHRVRPVEFSGRFSYIKYPHVTYKFRRFDQVGDPQALREEPELEVQWMCSPVTKNPILLSDLKPAMDLGHKMCVSCIAACDRNEISLPGFRHE